ncbi:hypothetical protein C449_09284 [Halococcus saccharolyticus DSM 5350]|uniref:Uncharacterized protein n=1 Tax=Halococcus saccharolyticus DSM 5350 TaxID=1227455 RepID=M0MK61_9EURY|nr:hypothetical protein C449_09284 [Halococcus saccharolyticus DSM 5350]
MERFIVDLARHGAFADPGNRTRPPTVFDERRSVFWRVLCAVRDDSTEFSVGAGYSCSLFTLTVPEDGNHGLSDGFDPECC